MRHLRVIDVNPDDISALMCGSGIAGTNVTVDDGDSLDISLERMITDNLAIEIPTDLSSQNGTRPGFG